MGDQGCITNQGKQDLLDLDEDEHPHGHQYQTLVVPYSVCQPAGLHIVKSRFSPCGHQGAEGTCAEVV